MTTKLIFVQIGANVYAPFARVRDFAKNGLCWNYLINSPGGFKQINLTISIISSPINYVISN